MFTKRGRRLDLALMAGAGSSQNFRQARRASRGTPFGCVDSPLALASALALLC